MITSEAKVIRKPGAKAIKDIAKRKSDSSWIIFIYLGTFIVALALSRTYASH